ncbi:hypothetical protein AB0451_25790 [Streptomyces sp. NPDC052000]|uniref:hypothetical protein n=1 Tax=Streptomyces sp. NPDC052000 TaxID=3155676 RepID=UPI00344E1C56
MLTYQDVVTARIGALTDLAQGWDDMADQFTRPESLYKAQVEGVAKDGGWVGESADAASAQFAATRKQFTDAQVEARAIASILRDAHGQFAQRISHVRDLVEQAQKNGMHVNSQGQAVYDPGTLSPYRTDYDATVKKGKAAAETWTQSIKDAVRAVDDADQGVKLALHEAAGIKGFFQQVADQALGFGHTFNGAAVGDIEVYEAREAKQYADQVLAGKKPDDLEEWERLMRDNSGDQVFSQTLLDSLGPDKTLKLSNKIDDLAYFDDTKHKDAYLKIAGGLSDSLASAMQIPENFVDGQDRKVPFGTPEYDRMLAEYRKQQINSPDFYTRWREALRELGGKKYDLEAAGDKISMATKGHGQQVRGYQTLATLMQQGHGFSPQFVADMTDDMIAAEKKDSHIWNLYGKFDSKNGDGWFANDPVDAALGVMSRNPAGAAHYLDPGTQPGKEHFDYLLGHGDGSRDWNVANTTRWGGGGDNVEFDASNVLDVDDRKGLGAALSAAATGTDPSSGPHLTPTSHTDANDRVFRHSLDVLSKQGDEMPASLRDTMAQVMSNHGHEVYATTSRVNDVFAPLDQRQVLEITKQISRSEHAYGMLTEGMHKSIVDGFYDPNRKPEDTLSSAGYTVGFMERARYLALKGDQHDFTWDKTWSYHALGTPITIIPFVGDVAQRGADAVTTAWIMDEQHRQAEKLTSDSQATYDHRRRELDALADQWYAVNSGWADAHAGYSVNEGDGIYKQIAGSANDGNYQFSGIAGVQ